MYLDAFYLSNNVKIYVPAAAKESYVAADGWKELAEKIEAVQGE